MSGGRETRSIGDRRASGVERTPDTSTFTIPDNGWRTIPGYVAGFIVAFARYRSVNEAYFENPFEVEAYIREKHYE